MAEVSTRQSTTCTTGNYNGYFYEVAKMFHYHNRLTREGILVSQENTSFVALRPEHGPVKERQYVGHDNKHEANAEGNEGDPSLDSHPPIGLD
jgi:hypothetical protein